MKADHEAFIHSKIEVALPVEKTGIAREIAPLLAANHEVWLQYGPRSELARKNPHSDAAYAVWLSERLATIVPNNRRISSILNAGNQLFHPNEQEVVAAFVIHARGYELWVRDEIPYEAVTPFPEGFEVLIKEIASAGT